jgi:acyl-CoA reductase-like NAD-dependent aldehyde dehydrogenase
MTTAGILRGVSTSLVTNPDGVRVLNGAVLMAAHFERFAQFAAARSVFTTDQSNDVIRPLGNVLLVCAPGCDSIMVGENLAAALAAGNRVAVSLPGVPDQLMRLLFELLFGVFAAERFSVLTDERSWTISNSDLSIVVLTPSRAYLNERPWITQAQSTGVLTSTEDLLLFYGALQGS